MSVIKQAAKEWFDKGFNVVAMKITPATTAGGKAEKSPLATWGEWKDRRQTFGEFEQQPWHLANAFAIVLGYPGEHDRHLACIDFDKAKVSEDAIVKGRTILSGFPKTRIERTPSGGLHFLYFSKIKPRTISKLHESHALELLGSGKIVVLASSEGYTIADNSDIAEVEDVEGLFYQITGLEDMRAPGKPDERNEVLQQWLEQIKSRLDVVHDGETWIRCLCPFHEEQHASFGLNRRKFYAYDWHDGKTYSLKDLAKALKITLQPKPHDHIEAEKKGVKRLIHKATFIRLNDHELLQQVYDPSDNSFKFILFNQETGKFETRPEYDDPLQPVTYVPIKIPVGKNNLPRITLASSPKEYESVSYLLMKISEFVKKYVELKSEDLELAAKFVLHTWIYDCSDYAMQILVLGDIGSGKTRLLKVLRLICYNALALSGGSTLSAYRRLQEKFKGTLFINEFEPWNSSEDSNELILWLNAGFERDLPVALSRKKDPDKQDFFDPFCPKLLTSRNIVENIAAQSRMLVMKMERKERKDIPIELPPEAYEEAAELRDMLLMFRLKHHVENYRLRPEHEKKLKEDETIDDRFKQNMLPMLILAEIAKLDVDKVFELYRKANLEFKRRIATTTIEGFLFNVIVGLCSQESFDDPEFFGFIDGAKKLVGIGTRLLESRTVFSRKAIAKALQRIGMVQEQRKRKVQTWNKADNKPEEKEKNLRLWVFPSEKAWREAYRRYFYREDEQGGVSYGSATSATPATPEILRSQAFIPEKQGSTSSGSSRTMEHRGGEGGKEPRGEKASENGEKKGENDLLEGQNTGGTGHEKTSRPGAEASGKEPTRCDRCGKAEHVCVRKINDSRIGYFCDDCWSRIKAGKDEFFKLDDHQAAQPGEGAQPGAEVKP